MFLWGHQYLLRAALKLWGDPRGESLREWAKSEGIPIEFLSLRQLLQGLSFPDRPCAELQLQKYPEGIRAVVQQHKLCHLWVVASELRSPKTADSFVYQSHDGLLATFHAMSPAPNMTVRAVRDLLLQQMTTFYGLALRDPYHSGTPSPSLFWLGFVLHAIQDSYSPAHTRRGPVEPTEALDAKTPLGRRDRRKTLSLDWDTEFIPLEDSHPVVRLVRRMDQWTQDRRFRHLFFQQPSGEAAFELFLSRLRQKDAALAAAVEPIVARSARRVRLVKIFELFLFLAQIQRDMIQQDVRIALPADTASSHAIRDFFHYPTQMRASRLGHAWNDRVEAARERGLLEHAVRDSASVLQRFQKDLEDMHTAKTAASQQRRWKRAVESFGAWLAAGAFALPPEVETKTAGWTAQS